MHTKLKVLYLSEAMLQGSPSKSWLLERRWNTSMTFLSRVINGDNLTGTCGTDVYIDLTC